MKDWRKTNCIIIIILGILTGLKYISEYIDVLDNVYLPDGIRFFFLAVLVAACHLILFFVSISTKDYSSAFLDVITGLAQLLVIGLRGNVIPYYGMTMSGSVILLTVFVLIVQFKKGINIRSSE